MALDVTGYRCQGEGVHLLPHRDKARLTVVLEESGGVCQPCPRPGKPDVSDHIPRHIHFAPAGMEMWGYSKSVRRVIDATLTFDFALLGAHLSTDFAAHRIDSPLPRFSNDRIWNLTRLLTEAIDNPDPSMQLYGDGIIAAITSQLFAGPRSAACKAGGLAPWQLRRVTEYMEETFPERVELGTLSSLINVSQSHFCRAFKISTGMAPYRWQLDVRIRRAQAMLANSGDALGEIALATGFADAVHFGRIFRKHVGVAPGAWRIDARR
ncbi:AraC family transcriptional regulator [Telluria beijingensis]|uniref:AraC family transcriptional regulator n=1 Tax=Telluria beijingensis TaxID=3068633 RepID=UPI002795C36D|nr:AraC family transcriptional regulator [Massilia sp. REN29]